MHPIYSISAGRMAFICHDVSIWCPLPGHVRMHSQCNASRDCQRCSKKLGSPVRASQKVAALPCTAQSRGTSGQAYAKLGCGNAHIPQLMPFHTSLPDGVGRLRRLMRPHSGALTLFVPTVHVGLAPLTAQASPIRTRSGPCGYAAKSQGGGASPGRDPCTSCRQSCPLSQIHEIACTDMRLKGRQASTMPVIHTHMTGTCNIHA